jgi:uncharacterized protein (DUF433 family)
MRRPTIVTTETGYQLIVRDPEVHGGEPVIRGTRVPIRSLVLSFRDDYPGDLPSVAAAYRVSPTAVEAALAYYRAHRAEIDHIVEQHERAAHDR